MVLAARLGRSRLAGSVSARWRGLLAVLALLGLIVPRPSARAAEIAVVTAADASSVERIAARELAETLQKIYPQDRFVSAANPPATGKAILVGVATAAELRRHLGVPGEAVPESFRVQRVTDGARELGIIAGADPRGTAYGVAALLEKLGCSLHLSGDSLPPAQTTGFDFAGWQLADRPLVPERLVFNWHNFLSGCSAWNLSEWKQWTAQSQKMGYNAIMVHAYGNNPMAGFTFNGVTKPVGYLSTTVKGRDWSTMHVTDVRRLAGGEVFPASAFGADAGLVPDDQREAAAKSLMRDVFADAAARGMGVHFAVDVDTPSANPQELVRLLPAAARFEASAATSTITGGAPGRIWLPNPDTPEGDAFFRAQVDALMQSYPQITTLVVWFRRDNTPWVTLKSTDLPAAWQREFQAEVARAPEVGALWRAPGLFAIGKILRAFDRALRSRAGTRPKLAAGTWGFEFLPAADRFFPAGVPLIGLDYDVIHERPQLGTAETRAPLREIGARRPVLPIVWAHHDDGHYIGRSYTPLPEFAAKLADARAAGFGIIHWTTRPLDVYFSSLAKQVWHGTKDQPLAETCRQLAAAWFGAENRLLMGDYLDSWITGAPRFGRDTSDWFIDRKLTNIPEVIAGCRARLAKIDRAITAGLSSVQRAQLAYYRGLEEWVILFHEAHGRFQASQALLQSGERDGARRALAGFEPETVVERFAQLGTIGGITRGEQGLVVSLNTRWLSHVVRHRQALGLEPVRIRFSPTSHDFLAQARGTYTFHVDASRALWECRGTQETGAEVFTLSATTAVARGELPPAWEEIGRTGLMLARPTTLVLGPIMPALNRRKSDGATLPTGDYRVRLLLLEPELASAGERLFEVSWRGSSKDPATPFATLEQIDLVVLAGGRHRMVEHSYPVRIDATGTGSIELRITPIRGNAVVCGVVLEPIVPSP